MLHWFITRGGEQGTQFEVGFGLRRFNFTPISREEAEEHGYLTDGEWLEDGRWFVRDLDMGRPRFGMHYWRLDIAFGTRYWMLHAEWPSPDYHTEEGETYRAEQLRGALRRIKAYGSVRARAD